jgi:Ala-tRNA(Pro) deacylase
VQIVKLLEQENVCFTTHRHGCTRSAQRMAHALHEAGDHVAKTVALKADGEFVVVVLQATREFDSYKLRDLLGAKNVALATIDELTDLFPDCEPGVVPPLGSLYGLRTLVDLAVARQSHLLFEGNTHEESVRMTYADFERLESPQIADISRPLLRGAG